MQGNQVAISAEAFDSDGSVVEIELYIDGVSTWLAEGSFLEYQWDTDDLPEGNYTLTAVARDDNSGAVADNIILVLDVTGGLNPSLSYGTVADYDGNNYATLEIGDQTWMAENLRVTHYADGAAIPQITEESEWEQMDFSTEAYCWYDNLDENRDVYGGLYTWAAAVYASSLGDSVPAQIQGVCPDGWHLPGDQEWKNLETFLGMTQEQADKPDWRGTDEGGQVKERGFSHWDVPNSGGDNSSGFTVLPAGFRSPKGGFYSQGQDAGFWTMDEADLNGKAWYRTISYSKEKIYRHYNDKKIGLSVRCVKDTI